MDRIDEGSMGMVWWLVGDSPGSAQVPAGADDRGGNDRKASPEFDLMPVSDALFDNLLDGHRHPREPFLQSFLRAPSILFA